MDSLNYNSVEALPGFNARAAFQVNSASVFKEDVDILPIPIDDQLSYVPWGGDNQMPFDILKLIEDDETLSTCQMSNAEVCFGSGLRYDTCLATAASSRNASCRRSRVFSTSSPGRRTAAKPGSPRSTSRPTARSSTMWSSTRLMTQRRVATGAPTFRRREYVLLYYARA